MIHLFLLTYILWFKLNKNYFFLSLHICINFKMWTIPIFKIPFINKFLYFLQKCRCVKFYSKNHLILTKPILIFLCILICTFLYFLKSLYHKILMVAKLFSVYLQLYFYLQILLYIHKSFYNFHLQLCTLYFLSI